MSSPTLQRTLVELLNKKPFEKNFTLVGFDAVEPLQLLQLLHDVLDEIGSAEKTNIRNEEPEDTLKRILKTLQFLKYKPHTDDMSAFRAGIIGGSREIIYPILEWLLTKLSELKVRSYLAKYLVPIRVPPEMLTNDQLASVHSKYSELMDNFKEVHKEVEEFRKSEFSMSDIKRDITLMDTEKDQLSKRIDRLRKQTERLPQYEEMLQAAKELRIEHEREDSLRQSENEQQSQLEVAENKLKRTLEQLHEAKANSIVGGADGLLSVTEEEHQMHKFLVTEKIPRELAEREQAIAKLENVIHEPAMSRSDLDVLNDRIKQLTAETNKLMEQRMMNNNVDGDRQLALYRQQASMIAAKKESVIETMEETQERLARIQAELKDKQISSENGPHKGLKDFKEYVTKLRSTSTEYKLKKSEMQILVSENATLQLTLEILGRQHDVIAETVGEMEEAKGIKGYKNTQDTLEAVSAAKSEVDAAKAMTVEEHAQKSKLLQETINQKKTSLAPLIQDLRSARTEAQTLEVQYNDKKSEYQKTMKEMDRGKATLEKEVRAFREEVLAEESRYHYLNMMQDMLDAQLERVKREMQLYVSTGSGKKKAFRDICHDKIQKLETTTRHLNDKQRMVEEGHENNMRQLDMWRDLTILMKCKSAAADKEDSGVAPKLGQEDRMIL